MPYATIVVMGVPDKTKPESRENPRGDFIHLDGRVVSPVFNSLADLFPWMREHRWKLDEYDHNGNNFIPWRVSKDTECKN